MERTLTFILIEKGGLCRVLSREVTWYDLCFKRIPLAAVLRKDNSGGEDKSKETR